jgi:hypothetical protein
MYLGPILFFVLEVAVWVVTPLVLYFSLKG